MMANLRGDAVRARLKKKFRRLIGYDEKKIKKSAEVDDKDTIVTAPIDDLNDADKVSVATTCDMSRSSSFRTNINCNPLKKSVSFCEYAEVHPVASLDEFGPEAVTELWHGYNDLQLYRREAVTEVRSFMRKYSVEDVFLARRLLYNGNGVPEELRYRIERENAAAALNSTVEMEVPDVCSKESGEEPPVPGISSLELATDDDC